METYWGKIGLRLYWSTAGKKKSKADALSQMHATSVSKDSLELLIHLSLWLPPLSIDCLLSWKMSHCLGISTSCDLKMLPRLLQNIIKMCYIPLWCGIFLSIMQRFVAFFYVNLFNSVKLWCFACLRHLIVLTSRWKASTLSGKEMRTCKAERIEARRNLGIK